MARKRRKKECDCIFCNSKCPECGSTNVTVTYRPCVQYTNDEENLIRLLRQEDWIELECEECEERFESGQWNEDPRLEKLEIALGRSLDLASEIRCEHKDGGEIEVQRYEWKSVDRKEVKGNGNLS